MQLQNHPYRPFPKIRVPIRNIADYSPFGVQLDGRTIQGDFYRYGYQGSEKDDESKGAGNSYTTYYRQLDPRVGRWFSIDPKMSAWESPYVSMGNNPVVINDIMGDTVKVNYGGFLGLGRKTATYEESTGKWFSKKGKEIESKNKFFNTVKSGVENLNLKENGKELVKELASSDKVFTIRRLPGEVDQGQFDASDEIKSTTPGEGSGGVIWVSKRSERDPFFVNLGHEMGHALSSKYGTVDDSKWYNYKNIKDILKDEQVAMYYENLIKQEHGLKLREFYSGDTKQGSVIESHPAIKF